MKREEVKAIFCDAITDEQLKALMDINGADVNAANAKTKAAFADLANANKRIAELEEKSMTAEERLAQQIEAAEARQREFAVKSNMVDVKAKFVESGISEDAYMPLLQKFVTDDAKATMEIADGILGLMSAQREKTETDTKRSLLEGMPNPKGSGGNGEQTMTREKYDSLTYLERIKLVKENPEIIEQMKES